MSDDVQTSATIASLRAEVERLTADNAFMRGFINNEDVRSDFQTVTQMRQALDTARERVREWNVLVAQGCTPGGSEFHDTPQNVAWYIKQRTEDKDCIIKSQQMELNKARERAGVLETALSKINDIRNSIIGFQTVNWSEHIYPLVAALKEAGIDGMAYPEALKNAGTLVQQAKLASERAGVLEAEVRDLLAVIEAHDIDTLDCDRTDNRYCDCLQKQVDKARNALDAAKFTKEQNDGQ